MNYRDLTLTNGYIDDIIYALEIKNTPDIQMSTFYLNLHLEIDNRGRLKTNFYDKRDNFTFQIVTFSFISSNIPLSQACGVNISQFIRYARACSQYSCFLDRAELLT
jgi:hypothetical protein